MKEMRDQDYFRTPTNVRYHYHGPSRGHGMPGGTVIRLLKVFAIVILLSALTGAAADFFSGLAEKVENQQSGHTARLEAAENSAVGPISGR